MSREILPILEWKNDSILVRGKIDRLKAHEIGNPTFHATAVIWAMTPSGQFVLADKFPKKQQKELLRSGKKIEKQIILDCFGGHLRYEDIPQQELESGLSQKTYVSCALRELSEELLLLDEDESFLKFPVREEALKPIGFYPYENDHNREYTWAFLYRLPMENSFASMDTIAGFDDEYEIFQPIHYVSLDEMIKLYENKQDGICFSDGISRILQKEKADGYQRLKELCLIS